MRNKFDEQLEELNDEMIDMGNMIVKQISLSISALENHDEKLAKQVMESDIEVDRQQKKIENICFNLLIQQQPVARDLRKVTAAMKIVTDMERIGDHAADISEMGLLMKNNNQINQFEHITKMASETMMMLNHSVQSYVETDMDLAKEVIKHDDVVDALFLKAKTDIVNLILNNPKQGEEATDLLMIAKYFERIGDHATNIAEWVIYSLSTTGFEEMLNQTGNPRYNQ